MRVPLDWLREYVDPGESLDDLVQRLIMSGTEVEGIERLGERWTDVLVGQVLEKTIPPGSKHLSVVKVDIGDRSIVAVTGAPNIETGQRVPVVLLGGTVPVGPDSEPFVLKPRPMMGITGEAIVLSERELGISDEHGGILVLSDRAVPGTALAAIMGSTVLVVEAKGRPDEMCILGVAREVAAVTGQALREPDLSIPATVKPIAGTSAVVKVEAPDLCPRFSAMRLDGITIGPSPEWLAGRLEAAGVRSINNVVDVTNYVMLELGQPLHAYDFTAIPESTLIIRRAKEGERIVTLDGQERTLTDEIVLVTDPKGPCGIGGVMGGGESEIKDSTTSILLEAANWDQVNIRRTSRRLGLRTEASARFERGVPPEVTTIAIARCLNLFGQVMDGPLSVYDLVDEGVGRDVPAPIEFTPDRIERLLGTEMTVTGAADSLRRLGFETSLDGQTVSVVPPYWRRDVEGVADIAEEIARMIGYDGIPERLPGQETAPKALPPDLYWETRVRNTLWGMGVTEAWTDSLTSAESLGRLSGDSNHKGTFLADGLETHGARPEYIHLANAPSQDRAVLRNTLVPSLLDVTARNLKHTRERIAFFEIARTFFPRANDLPYERRTLGIVLAGDRHPRTWNRDRAQYDFFDLKGILTAVARVMLSGGAEVIVEPSSTHGLHPGRSAVIMAGTDVVSRFGELHPALGEVFEIEDPVRAYVAEVNLDRLVALAGPPGNVTQVSRYPAVKRDISLTFPADTHAATIVAVILHSGGQLLTDARIVDVYSSQGVEAGRKSLAIALEFQSGDETLTQEGVSQIQDGIVRRLEADLDAVLRA